jgi:serpin B
MRYGWLRVGLLVGGLAGGGGAAAEETATAAVAPATRAINALGLDLLRKATGDGNAVISPYSIQSALAMTYAGAAGDTKTEMARVLHFPDDETGLHRSFAALQRSLGQIETRTAEIAKRSKKTGGLSEPVTLRVASRLYGQTGYQFRAAFLALLNNTYRASFEPMDFRNNAAAAIESINAWIARQTAGRIPDLIRAGGLRPDTRLALVNAVYFKASWQHRFTVRETIPRFFRVSGSKPAAVPTMETVSDFGYAEHDDFTAVTLPYIGGQIQLLIVLPAIGKDLARVEAQLSAELLATLAHAKAREVILFLPKLKSDSPAMSLGPALQSLGLRQAFDQPPGSANFDRIAPRHPDDNLALSAVLHKTFLVLDEGGAEAASASAGVAVAAAHVSDPKPRPIEVRVDRPFLFAIQHRQSGACLFLGRVTDPR